MNYLRMFFHIFIVVYIMNSCSDSPTENNNTVNVSGKVTIENRTDHSGVRVSIYNLVELDTTLLRINQKYPNIGVKISQETDFDHRKQKPEYTTLSSVDGSWKIEGIVPGTYNFVAEKDSFGWQYKNEKEVPNNINFVLSEVLIIKNTIIDNLIVNEGQFIVIENDVVLADGISIDFQGNNTILIADNKVMRVYGDLIKRDNSYLKITSLDLENKGKSISFEKEGDFAFEYIIFSDMKFGLVSNKNLNTNISFKNCIWKYNDVGLYVKYGELMIFNSNFHLNEIYDIEVLSECTFNDNILYNSGGLYYNDNVGTINGNIFEHNEIAITPYKGDIKICQNRFNQNDLSIAVNSSECEISHNNFYSGNVDIELNKNYVQAPILDYSKPLIRWNNFFDSEIAMTVWGENPIYGGGEFSLGVGINEDLDVINCYWGFTNTFSIDQKIIDVKDNTEFRDYKYFILYEPFEMTAVPESGLR